MRCEATRVQSAALLSICHGVKLFRSITIHSMLRRSRMRFPKIYFVLFGFLVCATSRLCAEPVDVTCTILPGEETASASLANPFDYPASCLANCKFSTAVYDDNPQIICAKPVPGGKRVEMCVMKAAGNKLLKVVEGIADCRKL